MTLTSVAYLEIEGDTNATFEFGDDLEITSNVNRSFLMGERGQYIRQIVNQVPGIPEFNADLRTGYWVDGGAGTWEITLNFKTGNESRDIQWGDDSANGDLDASGTDGDPWQRLNVFQNWMARTRMDSTGAARLHWGEWTDGSINHVTGVSAGEFGQPMPVTVVDSSVNTPTVRGDDTAGATGSITMNHIALWGGAEAPDWIADFIGAVTEAADIIPDE